MKRIDFFALFIGMEEQKGQTPIVNNQSEIQNEINERLRSTANQPNKATSPQPTGTAIEDEMRLKEAGEDINTNKKLQKEIDFWNAKYKNQRGGKHNSRCACDLCRASHKNYWSKENKANQPTGDKQPTAPPPPPITKDTDLITMTINSTVIPIIAKHKKVKRNVKQCQYTDEQRTMLATMLPPDAMNALQPSWAMYSITAIVLLINNILQADKIKEEKVDKEINELKKQMEDFKNARGKPLDTIPTVEATPVN